MQLQPVARRSVSDAVFDQLQAQIVGGGLAAGEALPAERSLTEALGVNRQAVREALKRLHQAGLVEISHGGATRVRDWRTAAGLDLLPALLTTADGDVDPAVARSIMEMRACIGPDAARLCALRGVTPLGLDLAALVDEMQEVLPVAASTRRGAPTATHEQLTALADLDWRFWELVIEGADNVAYRLAFNSLRAGSEPLGELLPLALADELRDVPAHRTIADAVIEGDAAASEAAARELLAKGSAAIVALLAGVDPKAPPFPPVRARRKDLR